RAEQGEDGVAAELLERAAVTLELGAHTRVIRRDERLHVLGIEALGARRRADEVDEDRGDHLALLAGGGRGRYLRQRGTTGEAELRLVGVLGSALGAERHAESVRPGRGAVLGCCQRDLEALARADRRPAMLHRLCLDERAPDPGTSSKTAPAAASERPTGKSGGDRYRETRSQSVA